MVERWFPLGAGRTGQGAAVYLRWGCQEISPELGKPGWRLESTLGPSALCSELVKVHSDLEVKCTRDALASKTSFVLSCYPLGGEENLIY